MNISLVITKVIAFQTLLYIYLCSIFILVYYKSYRFLCLLCEYGVMKRNEMVHLHIIVFFSCFTLFFYPPVTTTLAHGYLYAG